jgi:crotonobetainyl-CoA:carnitine CoA-transferase CaiB-like acyl-CoA transferase
MTKPAPLAGIRIVSIAQYVPGPLAVARLVSHGATATKVEPMSGDPFEPMSPSWYAEIHRGVDVERCDLKSDEGRARLIELMRGADLFITSHRPSALERLRLDPATIAKELPELRTLRIVGSIAEPDVAGHDLTYQAHAGLIRDKLPLTLAGDVMTSERTVSEALILLRRPAGSIADVGLVESLAPLQAPLLHGLTARGGMLGGALPAYQVFHAATGVIAVAALEPHFERRLYEALDLPIGSDLTDAMKARSAQEWEAWARERDLPIAAVHGT